jgi:hypothetical protein
MKNFIQWAEEKNLGDELRKLVEQPASKDTKAEGSTKRAAVRPWAYPELYGRGQYPDEYFRPTAADAVTYQKK